MGGATPPPSPTRQLELVLVQVLVFPLQCRVRPRCLAKFLLLLALTSTLMLLLLELRSENQSSSSFTKVRGQGHLHIQPRVYYTDKQIQQKPRQEKPSPTWELGKLYEGTSKMPGCKEADVIVHLLITSAPEHQAVRNDIRQTFCDKTQKYNGKVRCTFLIGQREETNRQIQEEADEYEDILMGNFHDTYRNLTLKVMSGLHWSVTQCSPAQYILKTDDDCFVNVPILLRLLKMAPPASQDGRLYVGHLMSSLKHTKVIRNPSSKWSVSETEYAPDYYPYYISGTGYLLSRRSAEDIVSLSGQFPPFPVEDAYVGVLAEQANIKPEHTYRFTLISEKWNVCNMMYLLLIHQIVPDHRTKWQIVQQALTDCRDQTFITKW